MQQNDEIALYQFGSSLYSKNFNDIDILVIYDEKKILSSEIYSRVIKPLKKEIEYFSKKQIHITCLNTKEEIEHMFLSKVVSKRIGHDFLKCLLF